MPCAVDFRPLVGRFLAFANFVPDCLIKNLCTPASDSAQAIFAEQSEGFSER